MALHWCLLWESKLFTGCRIISSYGGKPIARGLPAICHSERSEESLKSLPKSFSRRIISIAQAMETEPELLPFMPELLADFYERGSSLLPKT